MATLGHLPWYQNILLHMKHFSGNLVGLWLSQTTMEKIASKSFLPNQFSLQLQWCHILTTNHLDQENGTFLLRKWGWTCLHLEAMKSQMRRKLRLQQVTFSGPKRDIFIILLPIIPLLSKFVVSKNIVYVNQMQQTKFDYMQPPSDPAQLCSGRA